MSNKEAKNALTKLIDEALKERNFTKEEVKKNFIKVFYKDGDITSSHLDKFFGADGLPEISYLLGMYLAVKLDVKNNENLAAEDLQSLFTRSDSDDLSNWLLHWLDAHLEHDVHKGRRKEIVITDGYLKKWYDVIKNLKDKFNEVRHSNSILPTLDFFPDSFSPLTVITGTGSAIPPERISDLFRGNTRLTDLFFLESLNLPRNTNIVSDRLVIDMKPKERIQRFGNSHLLLIGGPKINAVTRKFCKYGFFRFQFQSDEQNFQDFYDSLNNEEIKNDLFPTANCVRMFHELLQRPERDYNDDAFQEIVLDKDQREKIKDKTLEIKEKLGSPENFTYEDIVKTFVPTNLIDPISNRCLPAKADTGKDITLITLAPNFYNREIEKEFSFKSYNKQFVSIIVAGIDRLGTTSGLKVLSTPERFSAHPVGGFLQAYSGNYQIDYDNYLFSNCQWVRSLTPDYTIDNFIKKVEESKYASVSSNSALQNIQNLTDLDDYLDFLNLFKEKL